mmetsp:Transcript_164601/g.291440  ORF Transcript_164601/g.291440 Transcript_164601/m.291440 type:complete len:229 (-) Transcript_164601:406-1092(-)
MSCCRSRTPTRSCPLRHQLLACTCVPGIALCTSHLHHHVHADTGWLLLIHSDSLVSSRLFVFAEYWFHVLFGCSSFFATSILIVCSSFFAVPVPVLHQPFFFSSGLSSTLFTAFASCSGDPSFFVVSRAVGSVGDPSFFVGDFSIFMGRHLRVDSLVRTQFELKFEVAGRYIRLNSDIEAQLVSRTEDGDSPGSKGGCGKFKPAREQTAFTHSQNTAHVLLTLLILLG